MPAAPENYAALSAMITPALFMTATGSLIISTSNRMSRIADQIRELNKQADDLSRGVTGLDLPAERLVHVTDQLGRLVWRSDRIRLALTLLYQAMAMFVGTSLTMAIDALIGNYLIALPTSLAIGGVTLLLVSCVQLTREARTSLRTNRLEVEFFKDLRAKRTAVAGRTANPVGRG